MTQARTAISITFAIGFASACGAGAVATGGSVSPGSTMDASAPDVVDASATVAPVALDAAPEATVAMTDEEAGADTAAAGCGVCPGYPPWHRVSTFATFPLNELSGMVASRRDRGVVYAHNDSGDQPRFFAMDSETGRGRGEFLLKGVQAIDWEDIALGPCAAGTCVFLGDTGDNSRIRASISIYVVPEPTLDPAKGKLELTTFDRYTMHYPDGPHDAETLLVDPRSGDIFIVTKELMGRGTLYALPRPYSTTAPMILRKLNAIQVPSVGTTLITGGDVHPCAPRVILRSYGRVFEFRGSKQGDVASWLSGSPALIIDGAPEPQGEAIAYRADGFGLFSSTEIPSGPSPAPLSTTSCR
ncbi:hypothetical protein BH09MYX1_BH09MYX1_27070 [soil metagenome]